MQNSTIKRLIVHLYRVALYSLITLILCIELYFVIFYNSLYLYTYLKKVTNFFKIKYKSFPMIEY